MSDQFAGGYWPRHRTNGSWWRVSVREQCPVCGHTSWCRLFDDGGVQCMRVESSTPCASGGWMHWLNGQPASDWRDRSTHKVIRPVAPVPDRAAPAQLDLVYRRLLDLCGLSDEHRAALIARGFSPAAITSHRFASLRSNGRRDVAAQLVAEFGESIIGHIPGLYLSSKGNAGQARPDLAGTNGILLPVRTIEDQIVGLVIGTDDRTTGPKYLWFSSTGKDGGCGSGSPLHIARPVGAVTDQRGWLIEGTLKGSLSADLSGVEAICIPGVGVRTNLVDLFRRLGKTEVVIAFDRDADTKTEVMKARDAAAGELIAAGFVVLLATWDNACKGLDDALIAGVEITVVPYPLKRRAGQMEPLSPEAVPTPELRPVRPLDRVRFLTRNILDQIFSRGEPGQYVISSQTGIGKTTQTAQVIADKIRIGTMPTHERKAGKGERPSRTVYLAPNKELVGEFVAATGGLAMVVEGRNPDAGHTWGCHRPNEIALVGENRHNPAVDVCLSCKDEYQAMYGAGWNCNYLNMKGVAEDHVLIAAPIASYFNGSSELRNFDNIIVDEQIIPALTETQILSGEHIDQWRQRMNMLNRSRLLIAGEEVETPRYGINDPFRRFIDLLALVEARRVEVGREWIPALPLLRQAYPDLGQLLIEITQEIKDEETKRGRFQFEEPRNVGGTNELVPLRLCQDLIAAIETELNRPEGADTRFWLTAEGLRLFLVRDHLVDILRSRTVIMLDATPSPLLKILFPELKEIKYDAPAPMLVTQITDTIATRTQLAGEHNRRRDRINEALDLVTKSSTAPAIFTFKGLDPNVHPEGPMIAVSNPLAAYGHFDGETRGVNRFSDSDLVAIVGRYSAPLNELRATVQGVRFASIPPAPVVESRDESGRALKMRPYFWRGDDGRGLGRWSSADEDPDVDELVRWSESSTIIQAIGRGRAVLRSESAPLQVYLFTNNPIAGLQVDRLISLAELGAPDPERQTPPGFWDARDERNTAAESQCRTRVIDALAAIREAGETITVSAVARHADVARGTIYRNPTLLALVEQAIKGTNKPVTVPVSSSPGYVNSLTGQDETPTVTDLTPVRPALIAADKARTRDESHRTLTDLTARLAPIAAARGREAIPKPGNRDISPNPTQREEVAS